MKTILSLLLLPIMVLAQQGQHQNEPYPIELFIAVEIHVREFEIDNVIPNFIHDGIMVDSLPGYLNTFSLSGLFTMANEKQRLQEGLNRLLSMNDPMFPKEDTLFTWLHPVKYSHNNLGRSSKNMPGGFGPLIKFYS